MKAFHKSLTGSFIDSLTCRITKLFYITKKSLDLWFCHLHFPFACTVPCSYMFPFVKWCYKTPDCILILIKRYTHCMTPHRIHRYNLCCHRTSTRVECTRHCYSGRRSLLMSRLFSLNVKKVHKNFDLLV